MKTVITFLFLIFPAVVFAQNQGVNQGDMNKIGQAMQKMMQCMAKIDQAELTALEEKSEQFGQEIEDLCSQGNRSKAQKKAIAYGKEMMNNPALIQMKKCAELNKQYGLPQGEDSRSAMDSDFDFSNHHVCDDF